MVAFRELAGIVIFGNFSKVSGPSVTEAPIPDDRTHVHRGDSPSAQLCQPEASY